MSLQPNSHHPVDFHGDLSFFGADARRLEVEHREVDHPRVYGEKARIARVCIAGGTFEEELIELDERTTVLFCQALLAGFDHPDLPEHRTLKPVETLISALQDLNYPGDAIDLANGLAAVLKQWGLDINKTRSTS